MTATFTLLVIDETHIILATERRMSNNDQRDVAAAFTRWKAEGGVAIIGDCLVKDRNAVEIELQIPEEDEDIVDAFVQSHGGK